MPVQIQLIFKFKNTANSLFNHLQNGAGVAHQIEVAGPIPYGTVHNVILTFLNSSDIHTCCLKTNTVLGQVMPNYYVEFNALESSNEMSREFLIKSHETDQIYERVKCFAHYVESQTTPTVKQETTVVKKTLTPESHALLSKLSKQGLTFVLLSDEQDQSTSSGPWQ